VQEKGTVQRSAILQRFAHDDAAAMGAVLRDLVNSGLIFRTGQGDRTAYRAATPDEFRRANPRDEHEGLVSYILVALNRYAPATAAELAQAIPIDVEIVQASLKTLLDDGRARQVPGEGEPRYECVSCVIPLGSSAGWEAAVFDHFQAMVTAVCTKLRQGSTTAARNDAVGGSTYGFDIWKDHPHRDEVLAFLSATRQQAVALRQKVEAYNTDHLTNETELERVLFYAGQTVVSSEPEGDER
jgi:hypothetical protein